MSNLRYTSDPLATGAWQVSTWDAGQSSILKWSPDNVVWNASTQTLDFRLGRAPANSPRPFLSGEVQSVQSASTGTWGWTAQVPDLVSGSIFGLFTFQANYRRDPWIEFDFEFLGKDAFDTNNDGVIDGRDDPNGDIDNDGDIDLFEVRLNIHMETRQTGKVSLEEANNGPIIVTLPFDVTEGQHTYEVTVTGTEATFKADGVVIGTFSGQDMPGGVWTSGEMKSFINLWCVDSSLEGWAGKWTYPGKDLVAKVAGATYQPLGGEPALIGGSSGGTAPGSVTFERQGTAADDRLVDIAGASTDFQGGSGNDRFCFLSGPRGGTAEKDVIWDFNPHGDTVAENDTVEISKTLAGVKGFSTLYRNITDVNGEAVLKFADGSTLTFHGLRKADLDYDDFLLV